MKELKVVNNYGAALTANEFVKFYGKNIKRTDNISIRQYISARGFRTHDGFREFADKVIDIINKR